MTTDLSAFIAAARLSVKCHWTPRNPDRPGFHGEHWRCVISGNDRQITVYWSNAYGLQGRHPDLEQLLEALAFEAEMIDATGNFRNWCAEYGLEPADKTARATYRVRDRQTKVLKLMLEPEGYEQLLALVARDSRRSRAA